MSTVSPTTLRARFARSLSELYGSEVPAYTTLVEVSEQVNAVVMASRDDAERLGSIERVTAERHGAIRLGTPEELAQVARIFGACGMYPVGFYDLREATPAIPVVSTAFRPIDRAELAANPFRVFTSLLVVDDRRFFDAELEAELRGFLGERTLFPPELLELADRAEADGGLSPADADAFIELATAAFALSPEPVNREWYARLEAISSVAADIGGVASTHINHLTPRVLDIDGLYARMTERGIEMIDRIQGPPRTDRPDVLLRQTSFRALAEPRTFREADGSVAAGELRVRFGEVEARGVALTPKGRELYDTSGIEAFPTTDEELDAQDLAYYVRDDAGALAPIVYEDFLPKSAAGIFASNLTSDGTMDTSQDGTARDAAWLQGVLGRSLHDPYALYDAERSVGAVH
ncbi:2-oxoadipate dioxygenase/decarboxylase [Aeromicrobium stalagmiti]|uniref:2-oxoadipate dioxygenase/decarboxylase n=1 Tax=Aeromicrobium stalagmiti TaxID=2738988 RepID=UPI001568DE8B|nr:VOC family protein [Aeromicrobium stalagmiti]NRQ51324.1 VOC family protein [Aeromicrobium stalagmiti]